MKRSISLFFAVVAGFLLVACDGGSSDRFIIIPNKDSVTIADGGELELKTVYKDKTGELVEKEEGDGISLTFALESDTATAIEVTSGGLVIAKQTGSATVIATLTDGESTFSDSIKVNVELVDTKKIFLNPSLITFEKEKSSKTLEVIGIDKTGFPTKLKAEDISYIVDDESIISLREDFTDTISRLTITTKTDDVGYTFITPQYNYADSIVITGSPALAQIYPTPQPNKPRESSSGGDFASVVNTYNSKSQRVLNIAHSDGHEKVYFHKFDSSAGVWADQTLTLEEYANIQALKLQVVGDIFYIVVATDDSVVLFASDDEGRSWSTLPIELEAQITSAQITVINETITVYYYDEDSLSLNTITVTGNTHAITTISSGKEINHFDFVLNNAGEVRGAMSTKDGVYYISQQDGKYYQERATKAEQVGGVKLVYDRTNNPHLLYFDTKAESKISVLSRGGVFGGWKSIGITSENFSRAGLKDDYSSSFTLDSIANIDAYYDRNNALRILVSEDNSVYYLKEHIVASSDTATFRIDRVATNIGARWLSFDVDKKDRLILTYKHDQNDWVRFWAEPILFDYRDEAVKEKKVTDTITTSEENLL